jgi:hypothetical protein
MTEFFADDAAAQALAQLPPTPPPAEETRQEHPAAQEAAQPPEPAAPPSVEGVLEFDPRHRDVFTGLLWVGHLTEQLVLFGHSFEIVTPTTGERLEMGPLLAPYQGTPTGQIAYQAMLVAAYLRQVDDLPLPLPIGPKDSGLPGRFTWVQANLRRPVVEALFDKVLTLEGKVDEVLDDMGKASG